MGLYPIQVIFEYCDYIILQMEFDVNMVHGGKSVPMTVTVMVFRVTTAMVSAFVMGTVAQTVQMTKTNVFSQIYVRLIQPAKIQWVHIIVIVKMDTNWGLMKHALILVGIIYI